MKSFIAALTISLLLGTLTLAGAADSASGGSENSTKEPASGTGKNDQPGHSEGLPSAPVGEKPAEGDSNLIDSTVIFEKGGALTPKGMLVVEPSLQYSHSSSNRVALVGYTIIPSITVGLIDIRAVESNTVVGTLALRYGLTSRFEAEVKVPYVYRSDSSSSQQANGQNSNVTSVFSADGNGIGDIEFGARYQLNSSTGGAYYIAGVRAKSATGKNPFEVPIDSGTGLATELPTGSGFWGIQPGFTIIVPSDPAVFFGSLSYMYNLPRNIPGVGKIDPGDIVDINFGMGFALNEKTSLSIGYDQSVVGRVKRDGTLLAGTMITQVGSVLLGVSHKRSDKVSYSVSLGIGVTDAAPGIQLALRVPFSY